MPEQSNKPVQAIQQFLLALMVVYNKCYLCLQGSVIIMYNWVKVDHIPHTWVTALIEDLALPINFIGLSTEDRRFVSPMKEVVTCMHAYFADVAPCNGQQTTSIDH